MTTYRAVALCARANLAAPDLPGIDGVVAEVLIGHIPVLVIDQSIVGDLDFGI